MAEWNLWHGCYRISPGCKNCYVYRQDEIYGRDSSDVRKTAAFDLPIRRNKRGFYIVESGETVNTCFTSDFFLAEADEWRIEAWKMIAARPDLNFLIITKRIDRLQEAIPEDWGDGYENVAICCTVENQTYADYRLPIYLDAPIKKKMIICEPLLGPIDLRAYLSEEIGGVFAGGESGQQARVCDYRWVLDIQQQCTQRDIPFKFHQTGAKLLKDGKIYHIPRKMQHQQAKKAGINYHIERMEPPKAKDMIEQLTF